MESNVPASHRGCRGNLDTRESICISKKLASTPRASVGGKHVTLDGEAFYQIANYDCMRPFFMSIVSGGDHWMFISSTGALTAGRRHPDLRSSILHRRQDSRLG